MKLASRKFLIAVSAILVNAWAAWAGLLDGATSMRNIVYLAGVYILGQAFVDGVKRDDASSPLGGAGPLLGLLDKVMAGKEDDNGAER